MIDIGDLAQQLIDAGADPCVAARVVSTAFAAGIATVNSTGNSTGIPPDRAAEKRRAWDRERKRNSTGIPPDSTGIPPETPNPALSLKEYKFKKERERGTRIPPEWEPSPEDHNAARDEGLPEDIITREAKKFRDYWIAKTGATATKLDWPATWRNWVRRVCEDRGFVRAPPKFTPEELEKGREWYARKKREQEQ
jgi:hypothetical protein